MKFRGIMLALGATFFLGVVACGKKDKDDKSIANGIEDCRTDEVYLSGPGLCAEPCHVRDDRYGSYGNNSGGYWGNSYGGGNSGSYGYGSSNYGNYGMQPGSEYEGLNPYSQECVRGVVGVKGSGYQNNSYYGNGQYNNGYGHGNQNGYW